MITPLGTLKRIVKKYQSTVPPGSYVHMETLSVSLSDNTVIFYHTDVHDATHRDIFSAETAAVILEELQGAVDLITFRENCPICRTPLDKNNMDKFGKWHDTSGGKGL